MRDRKHQAAMAVESLKKDYPDAICSLNYEKPYELLISTRLAAQCTDIRVNTVTRELFPRYPTLESFSEADPDDVRKIIAPCGLGPTKSKDIVNMARMIIADFDGVVPDNMHDLLRLPGVGRKTANIILGDVYHKPAVVCDTHFIRITGRLGLTASNKPNIVEKDLIKLLDPAESSDFCHRTVLHGRAICKARSPQCEICSMNSFCDTFNQQQNPPSKQKKEKQSQ